MTDISVIVICKDSAATIERALDSIRSQSIKPIEVIAVAAPSVDGTIEILKTRKDVVILNQQGRGIGDARNFGISEAKGSYIAFLDADDEWVPNALEMQYTALEQDPSAMVAMGLLVKIADNELEVFPEPMAAVTPGGCLFRAEVFSCLEGFDTDVTVVADHKWFMQARLKGIKFASHQGIILRKHIHGQNISVLRRQKYRNELIALLRGGRS
jgi:glycosyltransferase involved in cell wall biosynthesis